MYRHILNTWYFPGRFMAKVLLLNFVPLEPEAWYEYWFVPPDMAPLWALFPWRKDDPRHLQFPMDPNILLPYVSDQDPRVLASGGPTTRVRIVRDPVLPPNVIWTQRACKTKGYPSIKEASIWAHPTCSWFGCPTPDVYPRYEEYLLLNAKLLRLVPSLVGKQLACWCNADNPKERCNADVLVKWANLFAQGVWSLDDLPAAEQQEEMEIEQSPSTMKRMRDLSHYGYKPNKVMRIKDDGF